MPPLTSGAHLAELRRTPQGVVLHLALTLPTTPGSASAANVVSYLQRPVAELLTCSSGRPWQPNAMQADGWWISRRPGEHRAGCRTGPVAVEVRLSFDDADRLNLELRWRNTGQRRLADLAVGLLLDLGRLNDSQLTIPGVIYNDNPSADPARAVPRIGPGPGGGFVAEEDRLPIPAANLEWRAGRERRRLSVFSRPQPRRSGDGQVRYGSLGVIRQEGPAIAALSGVLMFDGKQDVRYISKAETESTDEGYLTLRPGEVYSQRLVLDWGRQELRGHSFRELVHTGRSLFTEPGANPLTVDEIIDRKTVALDNRWYRSGTVAGHTKFSDVTDNGPTKARHFMYGWTGQALKLAWCDARLGFETGDRVRIDRCRAAVEFYLAGSSTRTPGLRHNAYQVGSRRWTSFRAGGRVMVSSRAYGETIADLAEIIGLFHEYGEPVPPSWPDALAGALKFLRGALLPDGTFPIGWRLDGTPAASTLSAAGIPCVLATLKATTVLNNRRNSTSPVSSAPPHQSPNQTTRASATAGAVGGGDSGVLDAEFADPWLLSEATTWLTRYHGQHARTFDRPFARSTLDAACEDKEAGMYYFLAAYELYRLTGDDLYAQWAEGAADWLLTWVYVWSPELDLDSPLRAAGFNAVGWPTVSVQNHHLDTFFPTYELLAFGAAINRPDYMAAARTTMNAMGQGICSAPGDWGFHIVGEQGEAFFQTHWQRRGHANTWNPSWVIAVPLSNALRIRSHDLAE